MRNKISKIIREIDEIAMREFPQKEVDGVAYDILEGLDDFINEMNKGSETAEYLNKLDKEIIKILRMLWQIGKENSYDPEYNFELYQNDEAKIERLKEIYAGILKDDKKIDIDVMAWPRVNEYMKRGFSVVFK